MFPNFTSIRLSKKTNYLILIFWIGLTSLIYEIYSTKVLFLFFLETSQAVTIAISAFLAGLAFSSLIFSSFSKNSTKNNILIIFWMQVMVAIYGYFILKQYTLIPQTIDFLRQHITNLGWVNFIKIFLIWIYLFIPAFFIGGSFPLINGLYLESVEKGTRNTGLVYFWDTFGSILGAFLAGFWLLPQFGLRLTCIITVIINLAIAFVVASKKEWRIFIVAMILLIALSEYSFYQKNQLSNNASASASSTNPSVAPSNSIIASNLSERSVDVSRETSIKKLIPEFKNLDMIFGKILFQEISPFGRITIGQGGLGDSTDKVLFINYRDMCHSLSHTSESEMGQLAVQKLPINSRVLNIGLGCGFTADEIAQQQNVAKLDIAEINPTVVKGTSQFFQQENHSVLKNPKTQLFIEDGAEFIRNTKNSYDAIVIDIEEVSIIYSSPLYTEEYFQIISQKLKSGGVLALWAHRGNNEFEKIIYNTLKSAFKNVNIILIDGFYTFYASNSPASLPTKINNQAPYPQIDQQIQDVLNFPDNQINTLDNKILEKYFNIQSYFNLPTGYSEQFLEQN